jgi:integrase/recombinase XerD
MGPIQPSQGKLFEIITQEMRLRNYSDKTIKTYKSCIRLFADHIKPKHPRDADNNELRDYLLFLLTEEKWTASTVNQVFNALRFLYVELYKKPYVIGKLPRPQKEQKLPEVLNEQEVLSIFRAVNNLKHRLLLMLTYSAGLRMGEVINLKPLDIDSDRGLIHIKFGKGMKDRYTILSPAVLS